MVDVSPEEVAALRQGIDRAGDVAAGLLRGAERLELSSDPRLLNDEGGPHLVAVPTLVDAARHPDLGSHRSASRTIGWEHDALDAIRDCTALG